MQRTDDTARNLRAIWLGTAKDDGTGGWRWFFDARFVSWAVGVGLSVVLLVLAWLVVPFLVLVACAAWAGAGAAARALSRPRLRWAVFAAAVAFALLLFPSPRAWLLPMPLYLAAVLGPVSAILITRKVMPNVSPNTPVRHWMWLLGNASRGPRQRRPAATFDPHDPTHPEPVQMHPLHFAALASTGGPMARFVPKSQPIEAKRWLPANEERAGEFLAWLGLHGYNFTVNSGGTVSVYDPKAVIEKVVWPGEWAYFTPDSSGAPTDALQTMSDPQFKAAYDRQGTDEVDTVINTGDTVKVGHNLGVEPPYYECVVTGIDVGAGDGEYVINADRINIEKESA